MKKLHWNELASFLDPEDVPFTLAACSEPNAEDITDIPMEVSCKRCHAVMRADAKRMLKTLRFMATR